MAYTHFTRTFGLHIIFSAQISKKENENTTFKICIEIVETSSEILFLIAVPLCAYEPLNFVSI